MTTKIDFINSAYSRLRISGLTRNPTPEDTALALDRLENMAAGWKEKNMCAGYNLEVDPDVNSPHNVDRKYWDAYESNLAVRLAPDFGKQVSAELRLEQTTSLSRLASGTATITKTPYPSRQPRGSKSRLNRYQRYYVPDDQAPNDCYTNVMVVDNVNDFVEDFTAYLDFGETVDSYTITAETGLTIVSDSITSPIIAYRVKADAENELKRVVIVVTTSAGRIETRLINFKIIETGV